MDSGWSRDVYQIQPRGAASYGVTTIDSYKSGSTVVLAENKQRKHIYYMGHYIGENGRELNLYIGGERVGMMELDLIQMAIT